MEILWLAIGVVIGLLAAWFFLDSRSRKQLSKQEERLSQANSKVSLALEQEISAHAETRERLAEMDAKDAKSAQRITTLSGELDASKEKLAAAEADAARLRTELEEARGELASAKASTAEQKDARDKARADLERAEAAHAKDKESLGELSSEIARTRASAAADKEELQKLRADLERARASETSGQAERDKLMAEIDALKSEKDSWSAERDDLQSRLARAEADRDAAIAKGEARGEAREIRPGGRAPVPPDLAAEAKSAASAPAISRETELMPYAAASEAAGGERDDLTKIKGVGRVLKGRLNGLGITTFKQIAEFTQADIDRVNKVLDFPGRIEREKWVDQARGFLERGPAATDRAAGSERQSARG